MYPQCPDGSHVNILAIETGVLPPPDSYLDRDNNIPPEDEDQTPPPPPVEIDLIWCNNGSWIYVPEPGYGGSGGFGSQPPSQPPSPGLSYRTPRTPSLRHRSATLSHHAPSHHSSEQSSARSRTLTEPGLPVSEQEVLRTQPVLRRTETGAVWEYEITMGDGTIRQRSVSPYTREKLWVPVGAGSYHPASPDRVSRVMAHRQLMESPLAPRSMAILQQEIDRKSVV